MSYLKLFVCVGLLAIASAAWAQTLSITQAGKKFSEKRVTIKVGESLEFVNDDGNVHNVHSSTEGHEFDLGAQKPNETSTHTFTKPGKVKVRCAIHPRMKMIVTVEE